MQDRPTASELLEAVRHFLERDVVPALDGTKRFHARVAANVLAIVGRELNAGAAQWRAEWQRLDGLLGAADAPADAVALHAALRERTEALCDRIRRGEADAEPLRSAVLAHVRRTVGEKLAITNPKLVARRKA
jgi:hypothetical protein